MTDHDHADDRDADHERPLATTGHGSDARTLVGDDGDAPARARLEIGSRVGRYELVQQVGAGAMGVVFEAHDPLLDRRIALKVVHPGRRSPRAQQRLLREAQALAQVRHPNVVTVNDVGAEGDLVYVAMEFVEGRTFAQWLAEQARSADEVLQLLRRAGEGLVAVHDGGLVHRDFKPDNVLVTDEGRVLVADLGIAQAADEYSLVPPQVLDTAEPEVDGPHDEVHSARLTRTGAMLGTPRYMAPEQFMGQRTDPRTDQFAWCVVLWEALYGSHPFDDESLATLALALTSGTRRTPPADRAVPRWVRDVLDRGLDHDPNARFSSMTALLRQLELGANRRVRRVRRRRWLLGGAGVGALAIGFALIASSDDPSGRAACDGEAIVAGAWGPDDAQRITTAFSATELPMANDSARWVVQRFDAYAQRWAATYASECASAADSSESARATFDGKFACLDDRRRRFEGLVGVLAEADETVVRNAAAAVLELPSPTPCAEERGSAYTPSMPANPARWIQVRRLESKLAEVMALHSAGAYEAALEQVRALEAEADVFAPLQVQVELVRGLAERLAGNDQVSARYLEHAVLLATELRMDEQVVQGSLILAELRSQGSASDAAQRWLRTAEAAVTRLDSPPRLRARVLRSTAQLLFEDEEYEAAKTVLRDALELVDGADSRDVDDQQLVWSLLEHLGRTENQLGYFDAALEHLAAAQELMESTLGPDHPQMVGVLSMTYDVHRRRGELAKARAIDGQIMPLLKGAFGDDHIQVAFELGRRGVLLASDGDPAAGIELLDRAVDIFERKLDPDHPVIAEALGNRGIILGQLGRTEDAVADQRRALRIVETYVEPDHPRMAAALDNLGSALVDAGQPEQALELHRRALAIWGQLDPRSPSLGISLTDHGRALVEADRGAEAVALLERAVQIFAASSFDPAEQGRAQWLLARALWAAGDEQPAREQAATARALLVEQGQRSAPQVQEIDAWLAQRLHE
ncbi:MAG: serine/threonine-protein kinase [Nannocystaceae bacterium]